MSPSSRLEEAMDESDSVEEDGANMAKRGPHMAFGGENKGTSTMDLVSPYPIPLRESCADFWCWDKYDKSHEVKVLGPRSQTAHFHPNWSNGTAGIRGTKVLNHGIHYWEIRVSHRIFGTSMMFGVGTRRARVHVDSFINLLGEDNHSWGLSHKGLLWHGGKWRQYTKPFRENEATTIGIVFNWYQGSLTYFKDGRSLGIAFQGLNKVAGGAELYPFVCSTAAKTEMTLGPTLRGFDSLQDRCRAVIAQHCQNNELETLPLPKSMKGYIRELM